MEDTNPTLRLGAERGATRLPWLDSRHTFSFGMYYDPAWTGFRDLVAINDDRVAPGGGFAPHSHRDMEIVSLVLEGGLRHRDDMGHGAVLRPGEVQRMSAGSGVTHEEFNDSDRVPLHFLQIWVRPSEAGLPPSWEQRSRDELPLRGDFRLLVSGDPADGAATWHQDAELLELELGANASSRFELGAGRHAFVHLVSGSVSIGDTLLSAGDAVALSEPGPHPILASEDSRVLLFDLP